MADLISGSLVKYTVNFDLNGGTAGEGFAVSTEVPAGSYVSLTIPTREGYTFEGWYTGESVNDGLFTSTTSVRTDLDLIAKWHINSFTVKFYDQDGKTLNIQTVDYGEAATAPTAPIVDRMKFVGWDTDFSTVTQNLKINAQYVVDVYTLTFNTDGGSEIASEVYTVGDIPQMPAHPEKGGYYFIGWYTDPELTLLYEFSSPFIEDTTLYAKFSENIPIYTADDLRAINNDTAGRYYLANDINLDGEQWTPIWYFSGILDGMGHKIYNYMISSSDYLAGFFTTNSGTIKNVTFADFIFSVNTDGQTYTAGAVVGDNSGTLQNCYVNDAVLSFSSYLITTATERNYAGGLVGANNGIITDCSIVAEMIGKNESYLYVGSTDSNHYSYKYLYIGGIAGTNNSIIENTICTINMTVSAVATSEDDYGSYWHGGGQPYSILCIGGAVGSNGSEIKNCNSVVECIASCTNTKKGVNGTPYSEAHYGGFACDNTGEISSCSADGNAAVLQNFHWVTWGGFVRNNKAWVRNCYTSVDLSMQSTNRTDDLIGGFAAYNENGGNIISSYSTSNIETITIGNVGGFVGKNESGATINKCFNTGDIIMNNSPSRLGNFVGWAVDGSAISKSYYNQDMTMTIYEAEAIPSNEIGNAATLSTLMSEELLKNNLLWNPDIWNITGDALPTLK